MQIIVTELVLQSMYCNTLFQLVRGIGMAQAVDATDFIDSDSLFGLFEAFLYRPDTQVQARRIRVWEEP